LISGSTWSRRFVTQPVETVGVPTPFVGNGRDTFYGTLFTDDLFTFATYGSGTSRVVAGAVHVPVGVLVQPSPYIAFSVRTGYRYVFVNLGAPSDGVVLTQRLGTRAAHYIPLSVDIIGSPWKYIDVGVSGTLYGAVSSDLNGLTQPTKWGDLFQFDLFVAAHFGG
jgi:hypothetical protein